MRNKRAYINNTSNYTGIARRVINNIGIWRAFINDDNGTIEKSFSCRKYGERDAKMLAIEQRRRYKREFNYIGD